MRQTKKQVRHTPSVLPGHGCEHVSLVVGIGNVSVSPLLSRFHSMNCRNTSESRNSPLQPLVSSLLRHFEEFFGTHAPLIENHLQKIMNAAETNINQRDTIAATLLDVGQQRITFDRHSLPLVISRDYSGSKTTCTRCIRVPAFNFPPGIF